MTELPIAILAGILPLVVGLIGTLYAITTREINLLRAKVHELANEVTALKTDLQWVEKQLEERTDP